MAKLINHPYIWQCLFLQIYPTLLTNTFVLRNLTTVKAAEIVCVIQIIFQTLKNDLDDNGSKHFEGKLQYLRTAFSFFNFCRFSTQMHGFKVKPLGCGRTFWGYTAMSLNDAFRPVVLLCSVTAVANDDQKVESCFNLASPPLYTRGVCSAFAAPQQNAVVKVSAQVHTRCGVNDVKTRRIW